MWQEPWLESVINFPFCELHCLGSLLSSRLGIRTSGKTLELHYSLYFVSNFIFSNNTYYPGYPSQEVDEGLTFIWLFVFIPRQAQFPYWTHFSIIFLGSLPPTSPHPNPTQPPCYPSLRDTPKIHAGDIFNKIGCYSAHYLQLHLSLMVELKLWYFGHLM